MKLTRVLLLAAAGVAVGLLLTKTDKGNQLRRDLADRASDWGRKLRNKSEDYLDDMMDDATEVARKARRKADGQLA